MLFDENGARVKRNEDPRENWTTTAEGSEGTDFSFLIHFPKWPILDLCPSSFLIGFISNGIHF